MFCANCGATQQPNANFCSGCGAKFAARTASSPGTPSSQSSPLPKLEGTDLPTSGKTAAAPDFHAVKILDAGDKLLLSGSRSIDVEAALNRYLKDGAKLVTPLCRIGTTWAAACTIPPKQKTLDDTQSLALAGITQAISAAKEDPADGCRVEELGFKRIIYGPSALLVQLRLEHMKQFGAEIIGDVEELEGEWVGVCDVGGVKNTGYRW